jgi:hypothetical protein
MEHFDLNTEQGMKNAVKWTLHLLNNIRRGGVWFIPRSFTTVTVISHDDRTYDISNPASEPDVIRVLDRCNWHYVKSDGDGNIVANGRSAAATGNVLPTK